MERMQFPIGRCSQEINQTEAIHLSLSVIVSSFDSYLRPHRFQVAVSSTA